MAGENALRNSVHEIGTFVVFLDYVLEKLSDDFLLDMCACRIIDGLC